MTRPLEGILVIALEQAVAAPYATSRLADAERAGLGAGPFRGERPRLIIRGISGYGDEGPYRRMNAYTMLIPAPPARCDGTAFEPGPVPALGEHSHKIRAEFAE